MSETPEPVTVTLAQEEQALVYFPGDGSPLVIDDTMSARDLREYMPAPIARAVFVARLRAVADMLDQSDLMDLMQPVASASH